MKDDLAIDDAVLRREAARRGCSMSELVETALRLLLRSRRELADPAPVPTFKSVGHLVEIADRAALSRALEGRPGPRGRMVRPAAHT